MAPVKHHSVMFLFEFKLIEFIEHLFKLNVAFVFPIFRISQANDNTISIVLFFSLFADRDKFATFDCICKSISHRIMCSIWICTSIEYMYCDGKSLAACCANKIVKNQWIYQSNQNHPSRIKRFFRHFFLLKRWRILTMFILHITRKERT